MKGVSNDVLKNKRTVQIFRSAHRWIRNETRRQQRLSPTQEITHATIVEQAIRTLRFFHKDLIFWCTDRKHQCTYVSPRWEWHTGHSSKDGLGKGWTKFIHPEDLPQVTTINEKAFTARERFSIEFRMRIASGLYLWFHTEGHPKYTSDRQFDGYLGWAHPINREATISAA